MSDKLSPAMSVEIAFVDGESPPARKFSAISSQLRRVSGVLEKAIGDIHGQSWPYTSASSSTLALAWGRKPGSGTEVGGGAAERHLDIANLARLIGPSSNLNPRSLSGVREIVEEIPVGVHEMDLKYPVTGSRSGSDPLVADVSLTNYVSTPSEIVVDGDYSITGDGRLYSYTATAGGTITYNSNPNKWAGGKNYSHSSFNVIPDPNQLSAGGLGCSIGSLDPQSRYPVTLPICTHQQSNIGGPNSALDDSDIAFNEQLEVPKVLQDNFVSGDLLPGGFLFLKNWTTNEMYEDADYYYDTASSILVGNLDLSSEIAGGDKFCVVTVGTDITSSIDDLRNKTFHTHNRDLGEPFVDANGVAGLHAEAGERGVFVPSDRPGNSFPMYLHRDGYTTTYDNNANDRNCMRGDILFGLADSTPGSYVNSTGETYGIRLGTGGTRVYKDSSDDLVLKNTTGIVKVSDSRLQVVEGLVGDEVGLTAPAPYATFGSFTPPVAWSAISASTFYEITLAAGIKTKNWWAAQLSFNPEADRWIPERFLGTPDWQHQTEWSWTASSSTLYSSFIGADWTGLSGSTPIPYRLVIWYSA